MNQIVLLWIGFYNNAPRLETGCDWSRAAAAAVTSQCSASVLVWPVSWKLLNSTPIKRFGFQSGNTKLSRALHQNSRVEWIKRFLVWTAHKYQNMDDSIQTEPLLLRPIEVFPGLHFCNEDFSWTTFSKIWILKQTRQQKENTQHVSLEMTCNPRRGQLMRILENKIGSLLSSAHQVDWLSAEHRVLRPSRNDNANFLFPGFRQVEDCLCNVSFVSFVEA